MAFEFKLPDIGEGIHEGEIVKWLVKVGDSVEEDQPLAEVMTDKATVELPSPWAGTVLELRAEEGQVVGVGQVLVVIGEEGEEPQADGRKAEAPAEQREEAPARAARAEGGEGDGRRAAAPPRGRVLATPATRRLARELEVDIVQVEGTGPGGRVTDEDVRRFAETGAPEREAVAEEAAAAPRREAVAPRVRPEALEERIPLRGVRRRISDHMHQSKIAHAHFTYVDEVDVTELVKVREELKATAEERGVRLTYLPFIVKAAVAALKKHPYLNASIDHEKGEIVLKRYYNVGIATATEQGLIVPVIHSADGLSILEIAQEIERLATKAREGQIEPEEIRGGTFTITSLGPQAGILATPIINSPESAILSVHEIKRRPAVVDEEIVVRDVMNIALSFDHRLIDGHVGAAFAKEVKAFLENPKWLLVGA